MKSTIGVQGEQIAADYLVKKGYKILDRNWHIRGGEIDIVALKRDKLYFVEVKTRTSNAFGTPEESVGYHKLEFLKRTALFYLQTHPKLLQSYQIDVIALEFEADTVKRLAHLESVTS